MNFAVFVVVGSKDLESVTRDRWFSFRVNSLSQYYTTTVRSMYYYHVQYNKYIPGLTTRIWSTGTEQSILLVDHRKPADWAGSTLLSLSRGNGAGQKDESLQVLTPKYGWLYQNPMQIVLTLLSNSLMIIVLLVKR